MSSALLCLFIVPLIQEPAQEFDRYFTDETLRLDYFHTGTASEEHFAVDRIVADGPWPGSKTRLVDTLGFGKYLFEVRDAGTGELLFSQGFATIFGEWETIGEAKKQWGVFHESLRFPWPKNPVRVVLRKRNAANRFEPVWETEIDPSDRHVNPALLLPEFPSHELLINGAAEGKVDLVILGDGYRAGEMDKFHRDAQRMMEALFETEPFGSRKGDFNVRTVDTPSAVSGVNRPHAGIYKRTPLSAHFSSFDSERYLLSYDNRRLREIASAVPYDFMAILVNERTYGGGGIYRWMATSSVDNAFSDYVFVHEFGHHFAALADEYYTSSVAYEMEDEVTVEPWEPNLTALLDKENPKWRDLVEEGTPLPTPWEKKRFEEHSIAVQKKRRELRAAKASEEALEGLFGEQRAFETELLSSMEFSGKVGAFEGAGYRMKGYYRPSADCIMFTRDKVGFCPVCSRAINRVIDAYSK